MEDELQSLGLSKNESEVYMELSQYAGIGANALAKKLNINRSLVYQILQNLKTQGLVGYEVRGKKRQYKITEPEQLIYRLEEKMQIANALVSKISSQKKSEETKKEKIIILEGKQGLKSLYLQMLHSKEKVIRSFGTTGRSYDILRFEMPWIVNESLINNIKIRMLASKELKEKAKAVQTRNMMIRYSESVSSFPVSTVIFDDFINILIFSEGVTILQIKNIEASKSYKSYFDLMWSSSNTLK